MTINDYCENVNGIARLRVPIETFIHDDIVTDNKSMLQQIAILDKTAMSNAPITIYGEKGSGRDLYAKYAHNHSPRKNNQFSDIRCSTIPDGYFDRTFFGGETWASMGREGILRRTNYGTLFLSDIDSMPSDIQYKLYEKISGRNTDFQYDVRLIASIDNKTKNLQYHGLIEELFYFLNVISISLPPLEQRPEDILLLVFYFLDEINRNYRLRREISWEILNILLQKKWGDEVKQLKNLINKLVWLTDGDVISNPAFLDEMNSIQEIEATIKQNTTLSGTETENQKTLKEMVHDYEVLIIRQYIQKYGSLRKAAKALGTAPASLSRKLNMEFKED